MLRHAASVAAGDSDAPTLVGGDMQQPNRRDYPPHEWAAIAADLTRANLSRTDGVADTLRAHGLVPTYEAGARSTAPSTAWNGAVVDYLYASARGRLRPDATYVYQTLASDHLPARGRIRDDHHTRVHHCDLQPPDALSLARLAVRRGPGAASAAPYSWSGSVRSPKK